MMHRTPHLRRSAETTRVVIIFADGLFFSRLDTYTAIGVNYALSLATQCGHMEVPRNNARAVKLNQEDHFTSPRVLLKRMSVELDQATPPPK